MNRLKDLLQIGFLSLLVISVIVVSCSEGDEPTPTPQPDPQPSASFTYTVDELSVAFDNTSTNAATYKWDFGDGSSSTDKSPSHTYSADGSYGVTLTTTNGTKSDTETQDIAVKKTAVQSADDYTRVLTNQMNEVIIPTFENYQTEMTDFLSSVEAFANDQSAANLTAVKSAYADAYVAYQAGAVHDYYATSNLDLVNTTNLYPVDVDLLEEFVENEAYNFNVTAQMRANGFPAIDYLLYGGDDVLASFTEQPKRTTFLVELVKAMKAKADGLVSSWTGNLRENFIKNGGTGLGSSISVQLNGILVYYEDHIRGNKVGLPIGRLGPLDTPIEADGTKIEAYHQSIAESSESFTFDLLRASIEEMEDIYLGTTASGDDGMGYEDLLLAIGQQSIDTDIKAQYQKIYDQIASRSSISGDESLYDEIQMLITLYKSDLLPMLNVQDADGANDGD